MGNLGFWLEKLILPRFVQERNKKLALHRMSMSNLLKIFSWRWIHLKVHTSVYSVELSYFLFHDTICNFADLMFFHFARQNALLYGKLCAIVCLCSQNVAKFVKSVKIKVSMPYLEQMSCFHKPNKFLESNKCVEMKIELKFWVTLVGKKHKIGFMVITWFI